MVTTEQTGPVQNSIDRVRVEMEKLVEMARDRGTKALDAVGIKPSVSGMYPLTDVVETHDALYVISDLAGVDPESLDVNVTGQILRLRGAVSRGPQYQSGRVQRSERQVGAFERSFALPCAVRAESTSADLRSGLLTIRLPKVVDDIGHKVTVNSDSTSSE